MRNSVPDEATCAICGRHFDPTKNQGWCQNPSCGEWQHPAFPLEGGPQNKTTAGKTPPDSGDSDPTKICPDCGNEVRADANFCENCANPLDDTEPTQPEPPEDDTGALQCPDCGFDLSDIPRDELSICPVCMYNVTPLLEEEDETTEPDRAELTECPNCGEDLSPIPTDLRTVCPGCRIDLDEALEADTEPPEPSPAEPPDQDQPPAPEETQTSQDPVPIETADVIEPGYGPRLEEAGVTTIGELRQADPDDLATKTGISTRRIKGWIEDTKADTAPATSSPEATAVVEEPELVLDVLGHEITVTDGQTIGSEIRSAMVDAGASEEDAVYVHRKHVRIDAVDGEFYLTRLGENPLEVNGHPVDKGSRVQIEDGDEINFSDVVDVTVAVQ